MDKNSLVINRPGVYLFHSPTKVSLQVNKELVVLFAAPERGVVGILLVDNTAHTSEISPLLDALLEKMKKELQVQDNQFRVKLLGLATPNAPLKQAVHRWLESHKLQIVAEDVGRGVARKIFVDCESGLAGVGYAESAPETTWLDEGSAKSRAKSTSEKPHRVLMLATSKVKKKLCRQSVEEKEGWTCEAPEDAFDVITSRTHDLTSYEAVIIVDDLTRSHEKPLKVFITRLLETNPSVRAYWSGVKRPAFATRFLLLPPITSTAVKKFKLAIHSELDSISGRTPGEVIPFPGKKKTA